MSYKEKIIKVLKNINTTRVLQNEDIALALLLKFFENGSFFPLTNWSMSPSLVLHICNDIVINNRKNIIEFGAGFSTLCIAKLIDIYQLNIKFICFEDNLEWLEKIRVQLKMHHLENRVHLVHAPVKTVLKIYTYKKQELWYDVDTVKNVLEDSNQIDLIIVDGPYGNLTPYARYSAIPILKDKIALDYSVFLDDFNRPEEKEIAMVWSEILNSKNKNFHRYTFFCSKESFNSIPIFSTL